MPTKTDHKRSYANRLGFVAKHGGIPSKPANTVAPTITGAVEVGGTLTYAAGTWTGRPAPKVEALWLRDGVVVGPATAALSILETDVGAKFRIREIAASSSGTVTAQSAETIAVPASGGGGGL